MSIITSDHLQISDTLSKQSILSKYINEVNTIPKLDKETELALSHEFVKTGNPEIANILIKSQLKNVIKVALSYKNYGISMMDIIAEGNLGLMHAVKKFDPNNGFRLSTYATWWIKAYIHDFILKSWSLVKIGTGRLHKRIFFNLAKIKKKLGVTGAIANDNAKLKIAAEYMGSSTQELTEIEQRISNHDISLNKTYNDSATELSDILESQTHNPEEIAVNSSEYRLKYEIFTKSIKTLNEREKFVLYARNSDEKATLDDLSKKLNISKERVRQIEERAMEKIKNFVLKNTP